MLNQMRNRRGVALPLALLGLVFVSFLVTSAIVTSGAELTVSSTHQRATASLYAADGALEQFLVAKSALAGTDSLYPVNGDTRITGFTVDVARLFNDVDTINVDTMFQRQLYSIVARPSGTRGRSVGAFVPSERKAAMFRVTVNAGLTVGGNISVTGTSTISDGRSAACDSAAAVNALEVSSGSTITLGGNATIEGTADTASYLKEQMVEQLLGGMTLQDAIAYANVKFGPGEYAARSKSWDSGGGPRPKSDKYNWGCPAGSGLECVTAVGNESNVSYYPMVAIDAGGGTVAVEGDHGQGVLIIHNGSAEIKGNMIYQGIVIVEQDLSVQGTGGTGGVKIEGAVVALGQNSTVEDNSSGNATIIYNKCVTTAAQAGANAHRLAGAPQRFPTGTTNWFELIQ